MVVKIIKFCVPPPPPINLFSFTLYFYVVIFFIIKLMAKQKMSECQHVKIIIAMEIQHQLFLATMNRLKITTDVLHQLSNQMNMQRRLL